MDHLHFETIDSTNRYLKETYKDHPDGTVLSTAVQTAGRGRLGRTWVGDGKSALFSILLKDRLTLWTIAPLPLLAAVALHKTLKTYARKLRIKWPNDIVSSEGKVAGILCESVIEGDIVDAFVVGFGVNVNTITFPDEVASSAASLFLLTGRPVSIEDVIVKTTSAFLAEWELYLNGSKAYLTYVNRLSSLQGERIFFVENGVRMDGVAGKIREDGSLEVWTQSGMRSLHSGEVSISGGMKLPSE
ncbi:MAG TPA: biotin--[acetyl-CoA-carboxylase] ligase [Acholeplasmatales bacterium]|nr:MAG: biotin--[acetyl-CoA-carboxylase] ligase [Tenericutes bacterium GWF2_57_13]HAQ56222.1 biotin--[acetyl-CoA-carboxylase] ligase [Acholeplasmatales bacterium]